MTKPLVLLVAAAALLVAQTSTPQTTPTKPAAKKPGARPAAKKAAPPAATPAQGAKPASPAAAAAPAKSAANPKAIIETSMGNFTCTLYADKTPKTVENFIGLAEGTKEWTHPFTQEKKAGVRFYDGVIFHRVIPNFMIQTGDALGNGTGNAGYFFEDEIVPGLEFNRPGLLGMANAGPATNSSQFFVTEVPTPHLNGRHTIFGHCEPVELVRQIARVARDERNDKPFTPVNIVQIRIERPSAKPAGGSGAAKAPTPAKPAAKPSSPARKPLPRKRPAQPK